MAEEEQATIEEQYFEFARFMDNTRSGVTINLYRTDFWLRQARLIDDRRLTMTDTGIIFNKFESSIFFDIFTFRLILTDCKYCNATFDSFLCWPPTRAGDIALQNCPEQRLSDITQQAFRRCGDDGSWLGRRANESSQRGWTNYTLCFPTEVQKLLAKVNEDEDSQTKLEIALRTRYLETVGFSISLIALLLSLFIFTHFKSLRNNRTNIHRNLFSAMTIQVIIRLIVYIDQAVIRGKANVNLRGIDDMPYICEVSYIFLEYAISAMFMWMFIEGLFLHNVVTANVLRERTSPALFVGIGWGLPILGTALWATMTAIYYTKDEGKGCWYGYNFITEYWLLQAPRLAVILINLIFLLNIMRVLITKLNATENNEITKVKKACRAALVLLPLLGITNILNMVQPVDEALWKFALWCYLTHFLRSFQGFFIALIYCFMNGEVNEVVQRSYRDWQSERQDARRARNAARNQTNSWWRTCLLVYIVTPLRELTRRIGRLCPRNNAVQDADLALETSDDIRRRNYADPEFQSCMEEIRLEDDTLVTGNV